MNSLGNSVDYYKEKILECDLAGQHIQIITKPGLPHWQEISPAEHLLAEFVHPKSDATLLLLGCGNGGLGSLLAQRAPDGNVWLSDTNIIALECTRKTLALNEFAHATTCNQSSLLPKQKGCFDSVIIVLPKGRKLARRWLVEAFHLLKPQGELYLSGANDAGIHALCKDAAVLMGCSRSVLGYKKGNRCEIFFKKAVSENPGWSLEAGIALDTWYQFDVQLDQAELRIFSLPGVFSYDHVDDGTALLLKYLKVLPGECILDAGCGYGILGLAAFLKAPENVTRVDMTDVNLLALACTQKTITENTSLSVGGIFQVRANDLMQNLNDLAYTLVLTNPPFHAGKAVDYAITQTLIKEAQRVLAPGGRFMLVANRFIRYDLVMRKYFPVVDVVASNNRYHIIYAEKEQ